MAHPLTRLALADDAPAPRSRTIASRPRQAAASTRRRRRALAS